MKNSSRPSRLHCGHPPPLTDTRRLSPGPGNGLTYTSLRPVSFAPYAIHRPSGENRVWLSMNGVSTNGNGFPPPPSGRIHKSLCAITRAPAMNRRCRPLNDQLEANLPTVTPGIFSTVSVPDPPAAFSYKLMLPLRAAEKMIRSPDGDQTGAKSSPLSDVNRCRTPRATSKIHTSDVDDVAS